MNTKETNTDKSISKKKKKKGSAFLIVIIVIAAGVFCFAGFKLFTIWQGYHTSETSYDKIHELLKEKTSDDSSSSGGAGSSGKGGSSDGSSSQDDAGEEEDEDDDGDSLLKIEYEDEYDEGMYWNYDAMLAMNPDTIGYIKGRGSGLVVDLPIVQGTDNSHYLDYLFDGTANAAGTPFMDCDNPKLFTAPYCIVYGHNMSYGMRMFGYLKQYANDDSYYAGHTEYDIYALYKHYVYKVFAIYVSEQDALTYTSPLLYYADDMSDEDMDAAFRDLGEFALSNSIVNTGYQASDLDHNSHIICLSTCYGNYDNPLRYIVLLVRDRIVIER